MTPVCRNRSPLYSRIARFLALTCICSSWVRADVTPQRAEVDKDCDGVNDLLELRLARHFAPQWRFHWKLEGDSSQQNGNETMFPSSVGWFLTEACQITETPDGSCPGCPSVTDAGDVTTLTDINQLGKPKWSNPSRPKGDPTLRIDGFCKAIGGDPTHFPTYFHCSPCTRGNLCDANTVQIQYYLFFPFDDKGTYRILGEKIRPGQHRGDWENINVIVGGITDPARASIPATAKIKHVIYHGHIFHAKLVPADRVSLASGSHPRVFIAWGTHAMYPEPGKIHNLKLSTTEVLKKLPKYILPFLDLGWIIIFDVFGLGNVYDDFFGGQGVIVNAWDDSRELVNLGEYCAKRPELSFAPWIRFRGRWGPDGTGTGSSPPSPPFKGRWEFPGTLVNDWKSGCEGPDPCGDLGEREAPCVADWEEIKRGVSCYFESGFEPLDMTPVPPSQSRGALLIEREFWNHGPFVFIDDRISDLSRVMKGEVSSVYLMQGAKVKLFPERAYQGKPIIVEHSCPNLDWHYRHGRGDEALSAIVFFDSQVYADASNVGYQDGSPTQSGTKGPYRTVGKAIEAVQPGGEIILRPGNYAEFLRINKAVKIRAEGGSARIGYLARP